MKTSYVVAALGLISCGYAKSGCEKLASKIPKCGQQCLADAAKAVDCAASSYTCQCDPANYQKIYSDASTCILGNCESEALQIQASVEAVCSCVSPTATRATTGTATVTSLIDTTTAPTPPYSSSTSMSGPSGNATMTTPPGGTTWPRSGTGTSTPPVTLPGGSQSTLPIPTGSVTTIAESSPPGSTTAVVTIPPHSRPSGSSTHTSSLFPGAAAPIKPDNSIGSIIGLLMIIAAAL